MTTELHTGLTPAPHLYLNIADRFMISVSTHGPQDFRIPFIGDFVIGGGEGFIFFNWREVRETGYAL